MSKIFKTCLAILSLLATVLAFNVTAEAATSGNVGDGKECVVRISQELLNKRSYAIATVKLNLGYVYDNDADGNNVKVIMKDERGNIIWQGLHNGKEKLKLGNDHRVYYISIDHPNPTTLGTAVARWSISDPDKCSIR